MNAKYMYALLNQVHRAIPACRFKYCRTLHSKHGVTSTTRVAKQPLTLQATSRNFFLALCIPKKFYLRLTIFKIGALA